MKKDEFMAGLKLIGLVLIVAGVMGAVSYWFEKDEPELLAPPTEIPEILKTPDPQSKDD